MTTPTALPLRPGRRRQLDRRQSAFGAVVWVGTAVFAAVHAALIVGRYHRYGVYTFDFGIFDQGLWLLSRFEDPFVTLRGLNLFADHSSYIMVLLAPLYWVWADPRLLLVVTVVALAAAGPLVYAIGRRLGVRPGLAAAIAMAFLAHPAMRWATWDNFHPELLVLPLMLGALFLILNERPWWAFGLVAMALTAKEDVALIVVPFGLWVAWRYHRRAGLVMATVAVAAFALNFLVLLPAFSPTGEVLYTGRYTEYGTSAFGIIGGVATSPGTVLSDVTRSDSLAYLRDMVLTAPTSLAAPLILLIGLPITMANALSTHFYQIDIRYHYTIYLLTVVGIAALFGARWLQARASRAAYRAGSWRGWSWRPCSASVPAPTGAPGAASRMPRPSRRPSTRSGPMMSSRPTAPWRSTSPTGPRSTDSPIRSGSSTTEPPALTTNRPPTRSSGSSSIRAGS